MALPVVALIASELAALVRMKLTVSKQQMRAVALVPDLAIRGKDLAQHALLLAAEALPRLRRRPRPQPEPVLQLLRPLVQQRQLKAQQQRHPALPQRLPLQLVHVAYLESAQSQLAMTVSLVREPTKDTTQLARQIRADQLQQHPAQQQRPQEAARQLRQRRQQLLHAGLASGYACVLAGIAPGSSRITVARLDAVAVLHLQCLIQRAFQAL